LLDYNKFQYFEKEYLTKTAGSWYHKDRKLNVFAAVDFAYSLRRKADYTAIVVIGVDYENNVYVLDIDRFRTDKISEYFRHVLDLLNKWDFKKIRAEVTAAQSAIVQELKDSYIKPHGLMLKVEEHRPTRHSGSKEERMAAILEPRYDNLSIYHYKGGNCQLLEEELVTRNPPHDDIKDALSSAIEIAVKPSANMINRRVNTANVVYSPRFGGIAH
jgi:phage terminase large subunit-like protein